jgi:hypothetical protein
MTLCLSFLCRKTRLYVLPKSEIARTHVVVLVSKTIDQNHMAVLVGRRLTAYKLSSILLAFCYSLSRLLICEYL